MAQPAKPRGASSCSRLGIAQPNLAQGGGLRQSRQLRLPAPPRPGSIRPRGSRGLGGSVVNAKASGAKRASIRDTAHKPVSGLASRGPATQGTLSKKKAWRAPRGRLAFGRLAFAPRCRSHAARQLLEGGLLQDRPERVRGGGRRGESHVRRRRSEWSRTLPATPPTPCHAVATGRSGCWTATSRSTWAWRR